MSERERLVVEGYDAAIFVYFYDESEVHKYAKQHSIASRRSRIGVVFSAVGPKHFARCATIVAHELCHTLGASDKYDGDRSLYPDGFADPDRSPPLSPEARGNHGPRGPDIAHERETCQRALRVCGRKEDRSRDGLG
jgi:hypothetical protein